jgi:hypothetical protein
MVTESNEIVYAKGKIKKHLGEPIPKPSKG